MSSNESQVPGAAASAAGVLDETNLMEIATNAAAFLEGNNRGEIAANTAGVLEGKNNHGEIAANATAFIAGNNVGEIAANTAGVFGGNNLGEIAANAAGVFEGNNPREVAANAAGFFEVNDLGELVANPASFEENDLASVNFEPYAAMTSIQVGPNAVAFGIAKDLLIKNSAVFASLLSSEAPMEIPLSFSETIMIYQGPATAVIALPKTDPEVFAMVVYWMYHNTIPNVDELVLLVDSFKALTQLYPLAVSLCMPSLANDVIRAIFFIQVVGNKIPSEACMNLAWVKTKHIPNCGLRRMYRDWYVLGLLPDLVPRVVERLSNDVLVDIIIGYIGLACPATIPARAVETYLDDVPVQRAEDGSAAN